MEGSLIVLVFVGLGGSLVCCCISLYIGLRPPDSRLARRITARMTAVEMEWAEAYDRLNGIVSRITKRDGLSKPKPPEVPPVVPTPSVSSRSQLLKEANLAKSKRHGIGIAG